MYTTDWTKLVRHTERSFETIRTKRREGWTGHLPVYEVLLYNTTIITPPDDDDDSSGNEDDSSFSLAAPFSLYIPARVDSPPGSPNLQPYSGSSSESSSESEYLPSRKTVSYTSFHLFRNQHHKNGALFNQVTQLCHNLKTQPTYASIKKKTKAANLCVTFGNEVGSADSPFTCSEIKFATGDYYTFIQNQIRPCVQNLNQFASTLISDIYPGLLKTYNSLTLPKEVKWHPGPWQLTQFNFPQTSPKQECRKVMSIPFGLDVIFVGGDFTGGEYFFEKKMIKVVILPGDVIFINMETLGVPTIESFTGERCSVLLKNQRKVFAYKANDTDDE
ncbi:hypothetical protein G9A89_012223 [Geosiphon pyriformis]|nr:hypothetical protein G9A89_012223 [Geosiphon pyriformis]